MKNFCELFYQQAQKTPLTKAVIYEDKVLTYKDLDEQSTCLAKHLKAKGINSGKIVALALYNGLDLFIGMLAIFKAGGAYLPIDPNYPIDRIKTMLNDAKPDAFITNLSLKNLFPPLSDKTILIDKLPNLCDNTYINSIPLESLAYIIYTSGSTGKPKGIMVTHRGLAHACLSYKELHPEKPIALIPGSISFDPSLLATIHAFIAGGTVCLTKNTSGIDPKNAKEMVTLIKNHNITHILCTPTYYSMILEQPHLLPSLKNIDLCGENIPYDILKKHKKIAPNAFLYNAYGPSEYAIGTTAAKIYDPITKETNKITIGKPYSSNLVYILDSQQQQAPVNTKGEIFIGGPGLASGYINQKSLTDKKFCFISFKGETPTRLYMTGDTGRLLLDGNIEFLGRRDLQIKNMGHAIEPGEIEYTIRLYPGISDAIVTHQKGRNGKKQLIAYFSAKYLDIQRLKTNLKKKLPGYMTPSLFIQVKSWPRNQNGKIDRNALTIDLLT